MGKDLLIAHQYREVKEVFSLIKNICEYLSQCPSICETIEFDTIDLVCTKRVLSEHKQHFITEKCVSLLNELIAQFNTRFSDFRAMDKHFEVFLNPFSAVNIPNELHSEVITIRLNEQLKEDFNSMDLLEFYSNLRGFETLRDNALEITAHFGSTYRCEQYFSLLKARKTQFNCALKDDTLYSCLRIATTKLKPNIIRLSQNKQFQKSH